MNKLSRTKVNDYYNIFSLKPERGWKEIKTSKFTLTKLRLLEKIFSRLTTDYDDLKRATFVEVPRAGGLTTRIIMKSLKINKLVVANTGLRKNHNKPALPQYLPYSKVYVTGDIFVVTGNTFREVILEIHKKIKTEFSLIIFCLGVTKKAFDKNHTLAKLAVKHKIKIIIYTTFVDVPLSVAKFEGKSKYIIGRITKNSKGEITGYELGDYGNFYDEAIKKGWLTKPIIRIIYTKVISFVRFLNE